MSEQLTSNEVFCSYADADAPFLDVLEQHLSLVQREGIITLWYKRQIVAGADWEEIRDHHLSTTTVILLLVSPDFLASENCYGIEMQRAMQRHEAREAYVVPILLRY